MGRRFAPTADRGAFESDRSESIGAIDSNPLGLTAGAKPAACRRAMALVLIVVAMLGATMAATGAFGARAETLSDQLARKAAIPGGQSQEHLVVSAKELDYDTNHNTVSAVGDVQLYYQGRVLQADRVIYDRNTNRVFAEGHAKLTDTDGSVGYADRFELTDDLKNGFIDSLRVDTVDHTHISAARAERTGGETTVFDKGVYTACDVCANSTKPPLWQVRAERIIHKNDEQMIYFEDADLELLGVPIAWLPYFSAPDPSVKRKTGFLTPTYITKSRIGFGVGTPFFWNIAPNKDLTVTPTILTRQGLLGQAEWRQQFMNGSYRIKATGINELDPSAFSPPPYGAGSRTLRGAVQTTGLFYLNQDWKFGWDASLETDKYFLQDYTQPSRSLSANYFKDLISSIYLTGQSDRGYLDIRGYYITDQSEASLQEQQPIVAPTISYNKVFDLPPQATAGIGGEVTVDANFTSLSRTLASYQATGPRTLDNAFGLYNVCENPTTGAPAYTRGNCLLNGVGGTYSRATVNLSWQRQYIDPIGQVWTPFAFARVNGELLDFNTTTSETFTSANGTSTISNASQTNFFGANPNQATGVVTPGAGVEYRFPLIASNAWATQVFEPIAQIIVRPNVPVSQAQVNEDAQSLVFDDSTLFEWNKYSGDDRFEGGTRANYGAQYTMTFNNGGYFNAMAGQSYLIAGTNSYATPDAANVGLSSGLDTRASDYVSRVAIALDPRFSFVAKGRFSSGDFSMQRLDLMANANIGALQASVQFARYNAQPLLGYDKRREGLALNSKYQINTNYFVSGNVIFDLTRHLYDTDLGGHTPLFAVAGLGLGAGYTDDCIGLDLNYTSVYQDNGFGVLTRNQTVMVELQLRTLGDSKTAPSFADLKNQDGLTNLE